MIHQPSCALAPQAAEKLLKIAGLLGSDQPGEVVAAAAAATRIIRTAGLTWEVLLRPIVLTKPPSREPRPPLWREIVDFCLAHPGQLSTWEREFLTSCLRFPTLSPKQAAVLSRLHHRISQTMGNPA